MRPLTAELRPKGGKEAAEQVENLPRRGTSSVWRWEGLGLCGHLMDDVGDGEAVKSQLQRSFGAWLRSLGFILKACSKPCKLQNSINKEYV